MKRLDGTITAAAREVTDPQALQDLQQFESPRLTMRHRQTAALKYAASTTDSDEDDDDDLVVVDEDAVVEERNFDEQQLYCICQQVSYGEMIACDN